MIYVYITVTLKTCNKMGRATNIISHMLLPNVTGWFTACIAAPSPTVELDNVIT